ncbi:MAG: T9SS type A sorting domain-containing protein [Fimbriimonadaceae bacterium]|nr:T9SS type A sorting domain-containing protein [Chitinophagales bacterium]
MQKRKFYLKEYSMLASSFIIYHQQVYAQVVYTDLEPDIVIEHDGDDFSIDMDNNGTDDFHFSKKTFYDWSTNFHSTIWAGRDGTFKNEIAASYQTIGWAAYSSYIQQFPYNFSKGYPINVLLSFQNDNRQIIAGNVLYDSGWLQKKGNWWDDVIEDRYLGVHFVDSDDNYHYGWIRCDVVDSGKTFIMKDYAYETKVDGFINAGDLLSYTGIETQHADLVNIFTSGNTINIISGINNSIYQVVIYDMQGKIVHTNKYTDSEITIQLPHIAKGVYLVEIIYNNFKHTEIIAIN